MSPTQQFDVICSSKSLRHIAFCYVTPRVYSGWSSIQKRGAGDVLAESRSTVHHISMEEIGEGVVTRNVIHKHHPKMTMMIPNICQVTKSISMGSGSYQNHDWAAAIKNNMRSRIRFCHENSSTLLLSSLSATSIIFQYNV